MKQEEIQEEALEQHLHREPRPSIAIGHVLTFVSAFLVNGVLIGISYGSLMARVDNNTDTLIALKAATITPEAARRISVLESQFILHREDANRRWDMIDRKLDRIEEKMDEMTTNGVHR